MGVAAVLVSAGLYALAFPPFDHEWAAWIALVPWLLVLRVETPASAARFGCLFGYAFGWATMWALAEAGARYFQAPMAVAVTGVGLYYLAIAGVPCAVFAVASTFALRSRSATVRVLVVPGLWVAAEFVRGRVFLQPWALFGYSQHEHIEILQVATMTGVYGVSCLLVLANSAIAELVARAGRMRSEGHAIPAALLGLLLVAACWIGGRVALQDAERPAAAALETVAIVQSNISPSVRWTPAYVSAQIRAHLAATETLPKSPGPALIVWPESSVPRYLETDPTLAATIAETARRHHADILFGIPRMDGDRSYNSVRLITSAGRNGGYYDKQRLVPLAEERPTLFTGDADGDAGDGPESFTPGAPTPPLPSFVRLGVSVCHEIIHPDIVDEAVRRGAELLVNVANDGWVGSLSRGAGEQHLTMAIFRAIETRRFLVRAAITGVSAVIDPYGRMIVRIPAWQADVATASVRGETMLTWYVQHGDVFALACLALEAVVLAWAILAVGRRPDHVAAPAAVPQPLAR